MATPREFLERHIVRQPEERAAHYRAVGAWPRTTVGDIIRRGARRWPDRIAVASIEGSWTYEQLDASTDAAAAHLLEAGMEAGQRVLCQLGNVPEAVVAYYGLLKAGLVPVCSIPQLGRREMGYLAAHVEASAYVVQADYPSQDLPALASGIADEQPGLDLLLSVRGDRPGFDPFDTGWRRRSSADSRARVAEVEVDPEDVAVLQLSGGTTAVPKAIPRLHTEYVYNAQAFAHASDWGPDTVVLHPLPLLHNAGTVTALQPAHLVGATFVLGPSASPNDMVSLAKQQEVTDMPCVPPAVLLRLLDAVDEGRADLGSLRHLMVAGQKLPVPLGERLERTLDVACVQVFGMGEGLIMRTPSDADAFVRLHTVGRPISPHDEVRILEPGSEREVEAGALGELCCRGPYTVAGYFRDPARSADAFTSDGFYRTGDTARAVDVGGDRFYAIDGRIKDLINRGGEKINAEEVEAVLVEHPAVRQAALVAMPDEALGERACAFLVLEEDAPAPDVPELRAFLLDEGLARFKTPERVVVVDELPLTNVGKVQKTVLRDRLAATPPA